MEPMLAEPIHRGKAVDPYLTDEWVMQPKMDGERLVLVSDGAGGVRCFNRDGRATVGPPAVVAELAALPVAVTLDGERLRGTVVVFDLMELRGQGAGVALEHRLQALEQFMAAWSPTNLAVAPTARTIDEKLAMMRAVTDGNGEGWVLKRLASTYQAGARSPDWRKLKRWRDVDCVVAWVGGGAGDEKDNMGLSMYRDGELVNVGECTRRAGDGQRIQPDDVVKVQVLYASDGNRLVQPSRARIRHDKPAEQCTIDQLDEIRTNRTLVLDMLEPAPT